MDLHAEPHVEPLRGREESLHHARRGHVLEAQHREAETPGSFQLREQVLDDFVLVEEAVGAHRDVDVAVEARELPTVLVDEAEEALLDLGRDVREAAEALEPDHLEAGAEVELGGLHDQVLERVAARVEVGREAVDRDAELRERHHEPPFVVWCLTQRSRITSGWPDSTMYGMRSAIVTSSSCSPVARPPGFGACTSAGSATYHQSL